MATPKAAQEVLAYCTSCKMDLNHRVVAMKGDKIVKVECLTCKKEHAFKAPKGITDPSQAPKGRSKKSSDTASNAAHSIEAEWEKLMASHKDAPGKKYSPKSQFVLGDKIKHDAFGEGIVGRIIYPNKVEVIFRTDLKILIHGGV